MAQSKSKSLRATIPAGIVHQFDRQQHINTTTIIPCLMNMQELQVQKPKGKRKKLVVGIVAVIVIIAVLSIVAAIGSNKSNTGTAKTITIDNENLQINYSSDVFYDLGPSSQVLAYSNNVTAGQEFTVSLLLTSLTYFTTLTINSMALNNPGFSIISISPSTPYSLSPGSSVSFGITIQTPSHSYVGPLNIVVSVS
jgi:uncharacterized membrane protein